MFVIFNSVLLEISEIYFQIRNEYKYFNDFIAVSVSTRNENKPATLCVCECVCILLCGHKTELRDYTMDIRNNISGSYKHYARQRSWHQKAII